MKLYINTIDNEQIKLRLTDGCMDWQKSESAHYDQSEKILPLLQSLLNEGGAELEDIHSIEVANGHGSFSSLRTGISLANALAYAFDAEVTDDQDRVREVEGLKVVEPKYDKEPSIG